MSEFGIYSPYVNKVKHSILKDYKPPDEFILFNDQSRILKTIKVRLPTPPPLSDIDGFGLPAREQRWNPPHIPIRLKELEKVCGTLEEIYDVLEHNYKSYETEINWIVEQWDRRLNGYWFFNNGKPTYIDGWHYFYLAYWNLDTGLPEYRSRDRTFFLFARFCYTDTTLPDGTDLGRRICLGFNYAKHRREGATFKGECINYEIVSRMKRVHGGIQSMDDTSAKKAYLEKLVAPWSKLPFFFKPFFTNSTNPQSGLKFDIPAKSITGKGSTLLKTEGLSSYIDFATTASRNFYDGDKLVFYHDDETGKVERENVDERHEVVRKCLVQGNNRSIHGFTIKTSTVGEMSDHGGRAFYNLCKASFWDKRNENGMTTSGLYNLFIPSFDGLDDFVDIFGNSIIDDPSENDLWRIPKPTRDIHGNLIGAKRYLQSQRDSYLQSADNPEEQRKYEENIRQFPFDFDECFITSGSGSGLNLVKIATRMKELQFGESYIRYGDFRWKGNIKDGSVEWVDNAKGKWEISVNINEVKHQQKYKHKMWVTDKWVETWKPKFPNCFTASADPYAFLKTEYNRLSFGAGAVFWHQDKEIDPDDKLIDLWESYRTVCTYKNRPPDPDDYAEDMLLMTVYFGAMMYPEINIPLIWDHFKRRGYLGYLKHYIGADGRKKATPGFNARGVSQQELFKAHKRYIELHCHRERHLSVLDECYKIKGVEELTDFDLFVAVGGAYMGAEIEIDERLLPQNRRKVNMSKFVNERFY